MDKRSKVLSSLVLAGAILALSSALAQAAPTWLTTPILGHDSFYGPGDAPPPPAHSDVRIFGAGPVPTTLPHSFLPGDPLNGTGSPSMSVFGIGQQVHTGSGIYLDAGVPYFLTMVFSDLTNPLRNHVYSEVFSGPIDSFWMTWNTPAGGGDGGGVPTLTSADIGSWLYTETLYLDSDHTTPLLTGTAAPFAVVPEPATLALLGLGLAGLGFSRRSKQV